MAKIDRLGWAAGIAFESFGLKFGVRTNDATVLDRVRECLPPGCELLGSPFVQALYSLRVAPPSNRSNVRNYHLLYGGVLRLARTMNLQEVFDTLENEIQLGVAEFSKRRVFVHAGVVAWKDRAIVIPGQSMNGKSTLVAALLRAGATYYSDEFAVLDLRGHVHPYARRLALRQPAGQPVRRCTAEELGSTQAEKPLPVALVALARYQASAHWEPRALSPGKAVLELIPNTLPAQRRPEQALAALNQVARRAVTLKGWRGEAEQTAHKLLRTVEAL
jgi:hypothetical protein